MDVSVNYSSWSTQGWVLGVKSDCKGFGPYGLHVRPLEDFRCPTSPSSSSPIELELVDSGESYSLIPPYPGTWTDPSPFMVFCGVSTLGRRSDEGDSVTVGPT